MKLDHLQQFVLVVETGSFTNAADFCGTPKSTISRNITALEKDLGTQLLQRTTRTLNLTDSGELFYQRALSILEQIEKTEEELSEGQVEVKGKLVAYVPTLLLDKCRHHVSKFVNNHPQCELELHSTAFGQRAVLDRRFDLLVYIGEPFDSSFIARPLADMGYDYFASPGYLKERGIPENPEALYTHRLIYRLVNEHDPVAWPFGDEDLPIKPAIICDSPYMTNAFLIEGAGIGLLPKILAAAAVERGQLVPLFDSKYAFRKKIYGIYNSRRYLPYKVKVLIEEIRENLPLEIQRLEAILETS